MQGQITPLALTTFDRWQEEGKAKHVAGKYIMSQWWAFEDERKIALQKKYVEEMHSLQGDLDDSLRGRMKATENQTKKGRRQSRSKNPSLRARSSR